MLMSAISAALAIGDSGAEGKVVGLVFSALALATFARMAAVAGGLQKLPEYAPLLHWAPVACWSVAGARASGDRGVAGAAEHAAQPRSGLSSHSAARHSANPESRNSGFDAGRHRAALRADPLASPRNDDCYGFAG